MKIKIPRPISFIFKTATNTFKISWDKVKKSLRLQLVIIFAVSILLSVFVFSISNSFLSDRNRYAVIDYSDGIQEIDGQAQNIVERLNDGSFVDYIDDNQEDYQLAEEGVVPPIPSGETIQKFVNTEARYNNLKILIVDLDGKVLFKSEKATESEIDLHSIIRNAMDARIERVPYPENSTAKEFVSFYPVTINQEEASVRAYTIVSGVPQANIMYYSGGESLLAIIFGFGTFFGAFYFLTKRKIDYFEELADGLLEISKGNLDFRVVPKSEDELGTVAKNINHMAEELQTKIEEERKAEQTKNELITNVSHDLRTPLTSVMGYLRLIKDKKYDTAEQVDNYVDVAYGKSEKLKALIEDLFEYTKLANQGTTLHKEEVNLNGFLEQLAEELVPIAEEKDLNFTKEIPQEKIKVMVDSDKLLRVFENLLTNAIKYSYKPGSIILVLKKINDKALVSIENQGDPIPEADLNRLFDRFYRVEKSRTSTLGGSGLGLAIAKNIIELHGGRIWAESEATTIRFNVELNLSV